MIPELAFTHSYILDFDAKLLWSRVLDAAESTKQRFRPAIEGAESYATVLQRLNSDLNSLDIGGQVGWRLATADEVARLLRYMPPPTLFHYFRSIRISTGADNVIGAYASDTPPSLVDIVGVQHANVLGDLIKSAGLGGGGLNDYGFWMVKSVDGRTLDTLQAQSAPVREVIEPIAQFPVRPISVYQVRRHSTGMQFERVTEGEATARVNAGMQTRYIAHYNLKPLPRGGFAALEVELQGTAAFGAPIPLMDSRVLARDQQDLAAPEALWKFEGSEPIGVWQFPNSAKLHLPDHIARNAYYGQQDLYVWFSVDSNGVSFRTPTLIAHLVKEEDLLTKRPRP